MVATLQAMVVADLEKKAEDGGRSADVGEGGHDLEAKIAALSRPLKEGTKYVPAIARHTANYDWEKVCKLHASRQLGKKLVPIMRSDESRL